MTIASEISRLQNDKEAMRQAIIGKGVDVEASVSLDDYAARIADIPTGGGDVDNLSQKGLSGTLYALTDTVATQNTPTLSYSVLDCNISDTSSNTQIHIQRIGSGVASNELKLKVRKKGTLSQNLKVEVRKGIEVDSSSEAYWYGDSNNIIASGSIDYSDITTDYAEITIELNSNFGGTRGELLDVVLYMDTVDASNYYCIACDSTQYSDAFSYVSYSGSAYTRSKLMPYCISDGFEGELIIKSQQSGSFTPSAVTLLSESFGSGWNAGPFTVTFVGGGVLTSTITSGCSRDTRLYINVDGTDVATFWSDQAQTKTLTNTKTLAFGTHTVSLKKTNSSYSSGGGTATVTLVPAFQETSGLGKPESLVSIGEELKVVLLGIKDGEFYDRDYIKFKGTGTTRTTGSIAPGNCVGFLTIKVGSNEYKIPYYT